MSLLAHCYQHYISTLVQLLPSLRAFMTGGLFLVFCASPCSQSCTVFRGTDLPWWRRSTALKLFPWRRGPQLQGWWRPKRCLPCSCSEPSQGLLQAQVRSSINTFEVTHDNYTAQQAQTLSPVLLDADSLGVGVLTDLQFEDEGPVRPGKARASTPQQASQTVRMLCSLTSDPQLVGLNRFLSAFNCIYLKGHRLLYLSVYLPYSLSTAVLFSTEYESLISSPHPARPLLARVCL